MKVTSANHPAMASWIRELGHRLDAPPFVSGAIESRKVLQALNARKDELRNLTAGHNGGLYNGPQFTRNYVDDPRYGVPFLTSGSMQLADLTKLPLLRRRDALSSKLSYLKLSAGMTLISCSGTVGRTIYCRPEMDGIWSSQDVIKVVPDGSKIASGYLYAFLSSRFGVPIVASGTYGSIIQHLEPAHLADLPVPRFGKRLEQKVHDLVQEAADMQTESNRRLNYAKSRLCELLGHDDTSIRTSNQHPDIQLVQSRRIGSSRRFDAFYYSSPAQQSDSLLEAISSLHDVKKLAEVTSEVFETTRFGRITVDDPNFGVPFHSISTLVQINPKAEAMISRKQAAVVRALVDPGWIILPRVGQLQGVFGTAIFIPSHMQGIAVSDNNIRVVPRTPLEGAYIWTALSTHLCYLQIIRRACGTSIPYLDATRVRDVPIPWLTKNHRDEIGKIVIDAMDMRSQASKAEADAVATVEKAIEENI